MKVYELSITVHDTDGGPATRETVTCDGAYAEFWLRHKADEVATAAAPAESARPQ